MQNRITAVLLAAVLLLSSCTAASPADSPKEDPAAQPDAVKAVEPSPQDNAPALPVEPIEESQIRLPAPVSVGINGINVSVLPVMELLSVIQYLSSYHEALGILTRFDLVYKADLEAHFRPYASHEAVRLFDELYPAGFSYDKPPTAVLYLKDDLTVDHGSLDGSSFQSSYLDFDFEGFVRALQTFYLDSGFEKFYISQTDYYRQIVEETAGVIPAWDMISEMEAYYGFAMGSYNIILASLFWSGGFGPNVERDGSTHIYAIQGPAGQRDGFPSFGTTESFTELVLHEFGHSFVSINEAESLPDVRKAVEETGYLFGPIEDSMQKLTYGGWTTAYEELVLRAVVIRMMERHQRSDPTTLLQNEYNLGFHYIQEVYDCLALYELERDNYRNFDAFVPAISAHLIQWYPEGWEA